MRPELVPVFLHLLALVTVCAMIAALAVAARSARERDRAPEERYTDLQRGSQEPYDHEKEGL